VFRHGGFDFFAQSFLVHLVPSRGEELDTLEVEEHHHHYDRHHSRVELPS
jgi:hypothetical protein